MQIILRLIQLLKSWDILFLPTHAALIPFTMFNILLAGRARPALRGWSRSATKLKICICKWFAQKTTQRLRRADFYFQGQSALCNWALPRARSHYARSSLKSNYALISHLKFESCDAARRTDPKSKDGSARAQSQRPADFYIDGCLLLGSTFHGRRIIYF